MCGLPFPSFFMLALDSTLVLFDLDVNVNSTFLIIMHKLPAGLDDKKIDCT